MTKSLSVGIGNGFCAKPMCSVLAVVMVNGGMIGLLSWHGRIAADPPQPPGQPGSSLPWHEACLPFPPYPSGVLSPWGCQARLQPDLPPGRNDGHRHTGALNVQR
jgi:hypothetical protein